MRFLPQVGLYNRSGGRKLESGVYWTTLPDDLKLGMEAVEDGKIYQLVRLSGTCCVGMIVGRYTGTALAWATVGGASGGCKPLGVSLISPTASGTYTFIQKYGKNTSIHCSTTFEAYANQTACAFDAMYFDGRSGVVGASLYTDVVTTGAWFWMGQALADTATSQAVGFVNCM